MSTAGDRPYCTDCPDREACHQGYPCDIVRTINDTPQEGTTIMSSTAKPGPNTNKNNAENGTSTGREHNVKADPRTAEDNLIEASQGLSAFINTKAIRALKDEGLTNEEIAAKAGLTDFAVIAILSEDVLVESKVEKLKGFFNRNKAAVVGVGSGVVVLGVAALKIYAGKKSTTAESDSDDVYVEVTTDEV